MSDPTHRCKNRVYRRGTVGRCNKPATSPKCESCQKARDTISEGILGIAKRLDEALGYPEGPMGGSSAPQAAPQSSGPKLGSRGDASQMQYTQCQQCMGKKDPRTPGKSCKKCADKLRSSMDYDM
jgi:hypothetical protein